jgi:hypothetical protein
MSAEPIFIVGVQRSGTTLLAAMLAAHSRLSCGPETHFFRRLAKVDASRLCDPETWPQPAIDFVTSINHTGFVSRERTALIAKYNLERDGVAAYLRDREPSVAAALSSVTEQYMWAKSKLRWVEKTPDHILHTATIRQHFPRSPIIRIVRDPRDVALSLMKVPWGVKSLVEGLIYWERLDRVSREFFAADSRSLTIRFEDLIGDPPATLRTVCAFIGESFETGMLDTSSTGAEINSRRVPWKDKVAQAPDASRVGAWRTELAQRDNQLAEALMGDRLAAFGYPLNETFARVGTLRPGLSAAVGYAEELRTLASDGVRFWRRNPTERSTVTVYLGDPGSQEWGEAGREHASGHEIRTVPLLANLMRARLFGENVRWISGGAGQWSGYRSYVLKKCLSPFRVSLGPGPLVHPRP